jgi:hypothetical protein
MSIDNAAALMIILENQPDRLESTYACTLDFNLIIADRGSGEVQIDGKFTVDELRAILSFIDPAQEG